jgi:hypothetical protein
MGQPASSRASPQVRPVIEDAAIQEIVVRLARPTASGGHTIERAAILAEGADCGHIEAWILQKGGEPQSGNVAARGGRGLHAERVDANAAATGGGAPLRYVLPAEAFS